METTGRFRMERNSLDLFVINALEPYPQNLSCPSEYKSKDDIEVASEVP